MFNRTASVIFLLGLGVLAGCGFDMPSRELDKASLPTVVTCTKALYISSDDVVEEGGDPELDPTVLDSVRADGRDWPVSVPFVSDRTATCGQQRCRRSGIVPRSSEVATAPSDAYPSIGESLPFAVWQEEFGGNVKVEYPRAKGIGLYGVVLRGVVGVAPMEDRVVSSLAPWSSFSAPGAGIAVTADSSGGAVLMVAYSLGGTLAAAQTALDRSERAVYWERRPGSLLFGDLSGFRQSSCGESVGDSAGSQVAGEQVRFPRAELGLVCPGLRSADAAPGQDWPEGAQDGAWMILYPVQGAGVFEFVDERSSGRGFKGKVEAVKGRVLTVPFGMRYSFSTEDRWPLQVVRLVVR
ncbi:MAG: hypothetical protein FWD57_04530 [Polyangiaceae bacterium]|nr:hypothetical protein [Polyangiaceae bacterium]